MPWAAVIPAAISAAGSVGGALLSRGGGSGDSASPGATVPRYIFTPSFSFQNHPEDGTVEAGLTGPVTGALANLKSVLGGASGELQQLQTQVTPGFGRLTDAINQHYDNLAQEVQNRIFRAGASDLRANLERRRILGSSFGADALSRQSAEASQVMREIEDQRKQDVANAFITELGQSIDLIGKRASLDYQAVTDELQQLNFASSAAVSLVSGAQAAMTQNSLLQQRLAAETGIANAQGLGSFISQSLFGKNFGSGTNAQSLVSILSNSLSGGSGGSSGDLSGLIAALGAGTSGAAAP